MVADLSISKSAVCLFLPPRGRAEKDRTNSFLFRCDSGRSLADRDENPMRTVDPQCRILTLAGDTRPRRGVALRELGVLEHGDVLVGEGKIEAIGAKLDVPEGTDVVDAAGRVLMPGFVDCHTRACWAGDRLGEWEQMLRGVSRREILQAGGGRPGDCPRRSCGNQETAGGPPQAPTRHAAARGQRPRSRSERLRARGGGRDENAGGHWACEQ